MPPPTRKPPGAFHHGSLREALLDAATRSLESDGADGVTLVALAASLGVTQPAVYRHFESRDALLAEVGARGYRDMTDYVMRAASAAKDPVSSVRAALQAYVRFACTRPGWFRLWHSRRWNDELAGLSRDASAATRQQGMAPLTRLLAGLLRADAPVDDLFRALWGTGHGLAGLVVERVFQLVETDEERLAAADVALDLTLDAVLVRWGREAAPGSHRADSARGTDALGPQAVDIVGRPRHSDDRR